MNAKDAAKEAKAVREQQERLARKQRDDAYEKDRAAAKHNVKTYVKEVEEAISKATKNGYDSTSIRLPGDERSQYAMSLAGLLDDVFSEQGYTVGWNYYRTHDIDYPDDHWSFTVSWV